MTLQKGSQAIVNSKIIYQCDHQAWQSRARPTLHAIPPCMAPVTCTDWDVSRAPDALCHALHVKYSATILVTPNMASLLSSFESEKYISDQKIKSSSIIRKNLKESLSTRNTNTRPWMFYIHKDTHIELHYSSLRGGRTEYIVWYWYYINNSI